MGKSKIFYAKLILILHLMVMNLIQLIGETVMAVRCHAYFDNKTHLQCFFSYWYFSNGTVISFPRYPDQECKEELLVAVKDLERLREEFEDKIIGKNIIDFHFPFFDGELDEEQSAIIELEGNIYVSENSFAPEGLDPFANIFIHDKIKFIGLNDEDTQYESIKNL